MAERIQLSRRKGYRKPVGAVVVSRPSKWGNQYKLSDYPTGMRMDERREHAVACFRGALLGLIAEPVHMLPFTIEDVRRELRGKDLACWCGLSETCHADILLTVANGGQP